ncbi:putative sulfate exporter family transporter [Falsochrobactrum shanghaiense]|uniref:Putative sulfate exporter family transporter n=1 Tax=Falsochrobactrum shanghaiense TaxID=2201899 RepID=A0A316JFL6_9HYPH|nr:YeiH family protein [Falsochrobactrum shanghaiense]PWL19419.1 putative sulfate exporter family transporter [Falsochrobactrum shanghaiense]
MPIVNSSKIQTILPGLALSVAVSAVAVGLEKIEEHYMGRAWLEALVIAILLGTAVRTFLRPGVRFSKGIGFSAKPLLEFAVVLLGASISASAVISAGPGLIMGIAGVVMVAILSSYGIGRLLRLPHRMAVLVACGNSICGNSAIAATAPVIGAKSDDVAASIAFTAILGVIVVLCLPLLVPLLELSHSQYGVLAGLTVYAVPQVLAATAPVATISVQLGTLVKLVRVLMLGPVILALALIVGNKSASARPGFFQLVPWFIIGFLGMMALRSLHLIPEAVLPGIQSASTLLTIISMAALGLGVDIRSVAQAGGRVTLTAVLSLAVLGAISLGLIYLLGVL